jgi:uncharacterized membrane protein
MTLDPLLDAELAVRRHVASALLALLLGPAALLRRSRDRWHRAAGALWSGAMLSTAASSFLTGDGARRLSPPHLLALFLLWELARGLAHLRAGRAAAHGRAMREAYATALVLAGVLSFLPGRRMSLAVFPDAPVLGFALAAALGVLLGGAVWRGRPWPPSRPQARRAPPAR